MRRRLDSSVARTAALGLVLVIALSSCGEGRDDGGDGGVGYSGTADTIQPLAEQGPGLGYTSPQFWD